ncbi:HNH endonuclease [Halarchaeum salinum]|uniref:HNH domain-containing protein n=1 Tax=Halarchaeum salinum TaxID=489912 RepID=A0AAV3S5K6_9EURY
MREKYEREELTIHEIADTVDVGDYAIRYWLVKNGIERRGTVFPVGDHPVDYDQTRLAKWAEQVKERDGHACVACSSTERLHAHHVVPKYEDRSEEMLYGLDNGETLYRACHAKRHRERGDESIARLLRHTPH